MFKKPTAKSWESIIKASTGEAIESIADFMGVYYNVIDTDGNFIVKNDKFMEDFPTLKDNCLKATDAWKDCVDVMKSGKRKIVEEEYNGRFIMSIKQPVYNKGKCVGISIISHDITEQKQAEIAKRRFIDSIHHDIQTPFVGICYIAQALAKGEKDPTIRRNLEIIDLSATSILAYLRDILSYVSTNSKKEESEFNLKECIMFVLQMTQPLIEHKKLTVEIRCPSETIKCKKFDFEQICLNLISNAIKFTDQGKITIIAEFDDKKPGLRFSVTDTGIGISKKYHEKIFEKFERVNPSYLEPTYNGCGMGLHTAKVLVEKMKGKIEVKSRLKHGSTFNVFLPINKHKEFLYTE